MCLFIHKKVEKNFQAKILKLNGFYLNNIAVHLLNFIRTEHVICIIIINCHTCKLITYTEKLKMTSD